MTLNKLFIRTLRENETAVAFKSYFRQYDNILEVVIMKG